MATKSNKCTWLYYVNDRSVCKRDDGLRCEVITVFDKQNYPKYVTAILSTAGGKKIRERKFDTPFKASLWCEHVRRNGTMARGRLREVEMEAQFGGLKMCRRQGTQGQLKGKLNQQKNAPYKISEAQYSAVTKLKYGSDYMHYYKWIEAQRLLAGEGDKSDLDIVVQMCIDKGDKTLARELRQSNKG